MATPAAEKTRVDLIIAASAIIPVEPTGLVLSDHCLVIDGGNIRDVLPTTQARDQYRAIEWLDWPERALMPGLVNLHTHAAMTLMRGIADDLPLMEWLQAHIWPAETAHASYQFCEDGAMLSAAEFIRGGVTCANDMYFFPDATAAAFTRAGLRAVVNMIVIDFPTAWGSGPDEYLSKGIAVHDTLRGNPLMHTIFAPHAPYTVSDQPLTRVRAYANELGIGIHMHLHETAQEVSEALDKTGKRPWQRLKELEVLGPDFVAVHMTQLTDEEIEQAAELGVSVAHCPESNLKLASGFCPVSKLSSQGVNIGIGTDGAASNNDLDMFSETRTAALLAKGASGRAEAFDAPQALHAATLGGARALGLEKNIGSLVPGKAADFIALDLSAPHLNPCYNLVSHLVYSAGRSDVTDVFVAGRALMRDRQLLSIDEARTIAHARQWRQKIKP